MGSDNTGIVLATPGLNKCTQYRVGVMRSIENLYLESVSVDNIIDYADLARAFTIVACVFGKASTSSALHETAIALNDIDDFDQAIDTLIFSLKVERMLERCNSYEVPFTSYEEAKHTLFNLGREHEALGHPIQNGFAFIDWTGGMEQVQFQHFQEPQLTAA